MRKFGFAVSALLLAGCEVSNAPAANESAAASAPAAKAVTKTEAQQVVATMHGSYQSGDAAKIMAHYAPGAVAFDPTHVAPSADRAVLTGWAEEFVRMNPTELKSTPTVQLAGPDSFVAYGSLTFTGNFDGRPVPLATRYSQHFQRQPDGQWRIVHEHMSLPPQETPPPQAPAQ